MPTTHPPSAHPSRTAQEEANLRPQSADARHQGRKEKSNRAIRRGTRSRRQTKWISTLIRLGVFSVFWSLFGLLAKVGVELMEEYFTKALPADQLLDMKVTLPMVMGVLALSVTQFILRRTGHDD